MIPYAERTETYKCEHYAIDVVKTMLGVDISPLLCVEGNFSPKSVKNFEEIDSPVNGCLVAFRSNSYSHMGVWVDNMVAHLGDSCSVHQPLSIAMRGFNKVRYYAIKER